MMKIIFHIFITIIFFGCSETPPIETTKSPTLDNLTAHSKELKKEVIKVTEGVHVAVGYALANAIPVSYTHLTLPTILLV